VIAAKVAPWVAVGALVVFAAVDPLAHADDPAPTVTVTKTTTVSVERTVQGRNVRWWSRRAVQARKDANARALTVRRLRRTLAHSPSVTEALALARVVYGVDQTGRVHCESHGSPTAKNKHSDASGLLQFMPGTWSSTPFRGFSVWSPYAASLAGGWMVAHGRSSEWACGL
jgi:hypothetical protein